jgi:CRISPR-associated protein Cmr3
MNVHYCFIEPLDVLFLRGNKLFGDAGSYGEALLPPWPSVAAGALRSRMLADDGIDFAAFANGGAMHPQLGSRDDPGAFTVTAFNVARRNADGLVEPLFALPADLWIARSGEGRLEIRLLRPTAISNTLGTSYGLRYLPVMAEQERSKPESELWLTSSGWRAYLAGDAPAERALLRTSDLWSLDARVGIGLDPGRRSVAEGRLFTVQAVAMRKREHAIQGVEAGFDVGFLAGLTNINPPADGVLRLGGDGRAASVSSAGSVDWPEPKYEAIARAQKLRLVLTTPGLFDGGWLPCGVRQQDEHYIFDLHGVRGRLVAAAVPRAEVISGWDLARQEPKSALRSAPAGSVYWLEDVRASEDDLRNLVAQGLWQDSRNHPRRAEGFNRIALAVY